VDEQKQQYVDRILGHGKALQEFFWRCKNSLPCEKALLPQDFKESQQLICQREWCIQYRQYLSSNTNGTNGGALIYGEIQVRLSVQDLKYASEHADPMLDRSLKEFFDNIDVSQDELVRLERFVFREFMKIKKEIEVRFNSYLTSFSTSVRLIARTIFNIDPNAEEDRARVYSLQGKMKVELQWLGIQEEAASLRNALEAEKQEKDQFKQVCNELRRKLYDLQWVVQREALNILNTRTFLGTKSKSLQGIRERLMLAISEKALNRDSMYAGSRPPDNLMPLEGFMHDALRKPEYSSGSPGRAIEPPPSFGDPSSDASARSENEIRSIPPPPAPLASVPPIEPDPSLIFREKGVDWTAWINRGAKGVILETTPDQPPRDPFLDLMSSAEPCDRDGITVQPPSAYPSPDDPPSE